MARMNINDVAQAARVSKSTVSRVLNNYPNSGISPATRAHVMDITKKMGFLPHIVAAGLSSKKTKIIGALIQNANNPFAGEFILAMEEVARQSAYHVILCNTRGNASRISQEVDMLMQRGVEGLVIEHFGNADYLRKMQEEDYPFVLLDRCPGVENVNYVTTDDVEGGRIATNALVDVGRRKIAHISGPMRLLAMEDRRTGFINAMENARLPLRNDWMVQVGQPQSPECGREAAKRLFDLPTLPDAIFCSSDYLALGVIQEAAARGLVIGKDVALVGYDDESFSPWLSVPLASVKLNMEKVGYEAMNLLLNRINGNSEKIAYQIEIPPVLVTRASLVAMGF